MIRLEDRSEKAAELFVQGYNCSQSVFGAYADQLGLEQELAMRFASSFGSGMGRMREVCGACSGMFMVAGMLTGATEGADRAGKQRNYELVQKLAAAFKAENGSIICRELLAGVSVAHDGTAEPEERTDQYYKKRPCKECIRMAAKIAAEVCNEFCAETGENEAAQ